MFSVRLNFIFTMLVERASLETGPSLFTYLFEFLPKNPISKQTYLSLPFLGGWHALILLSFLLFWLAGWDTFCLPGSLRLLDYDVVLDIELIVHIHDIDLYSLAIHILLSMLSISVVCATGMPAIIVGGHNPLNMEKLLRHVFLNVLLLRGFSFI